MSPHEKTNPKNTNPHKDTLQHHGLASSSIAVFTVLTVLVTMKQTVGLEAMLDYLEEYQKTVARSNPRLSRAVARALEPMDVEKIYRQAMHESKRGKKKETQ